MDPRAVIAAVRDGRARPGDVAAFAHALAGRGISDAQAGAFAMAVCLTGLTAEARVALTAAMRDSGEVLAWDLPGPVVDKHSTGGIGDCSSLVLAPALAACGAFVPMVSGRGLGHSGGTLDKLEAIPGFRAEQETEDFRRIVAAEGCAIVAASARLAPADRRLYAIRDVTATVESLDLITASILSKKLAAGIPALVLDVKTGSGAFLPERAAALTLARELVATANGAGCRTVARLTDMSQPLAPAIGNALEVQAALATLEGAPGRLRDLALALGGEALALCGLAASPAEGQGPIAAALDSGQARERFWRMVRAQGGAEGALPAAPVRRPVRAEGRLAGWDGRALGELVVALGGGRRQAGDRIDPAVGLSDIAPLGSDLADRPLAVIHARDMAAAERAEAALRAAFTTGMVAPPPLLQDRIA